MSKCLRCNQHEARMHPQYGAIDCDECQKKSGESGSHPYFLTPTQYDRIMSQRDKHLGEIAQPWNPDGSINEVFVKSGTREEALTYFTKEQLDREGL